MSTAVAADTNKQVARPLRVLAPLIKEDLRHGNEAAKAAGLPYYRAAGQKLLEAKGQVDRGDFTAWVSRNFKISGTQARLYMSLAVATLGRPNNATAAFSSLEDFQRRHLGRESRTNKTYPQAWHDPVRKIINRVDVETLRDAELKRADEREAERKLALQLIDIGFKTLATKLHPDKGGSRDAMARLNRVRDRLKAHA